MHKGFIKMAAILGALAVILGAFGAHGLKPLLTDKELATYETAVRYQFYHVFALLITGILYREFAQKYLSWAGKLFAFGIFIFSGSLYMLTFMNLSGRPNFQWLGAITPLGGVCFVAGWLFILLAVLKKN
ncbi:DUF423 domain-containing protein [soil metagenome]